VLFDFSPVSGGKSNEKLVAFLCGWSPIAREVATGIQCLPPALVALASDWAVTNRLKWRVQVNNGRLDCSQVGHMAHKQSVSVPVPRAKTRTRARNRAQTKPSLFAGCKRA